MFQSFSNLPIVQQRGGDSGIRFSRMATASTAIQAGFVGVINNIGGMPADSDLQRVASEHIQRRGRGFDLCRTR